MPAQSIKPMKRLGLTAYHCHGVWVLLVRDTDYGKVIMNGLRFCSDCKFDIDYEVPFPCADGTHEWHQPDADSSNMCCKCGLDWEALFK